MSQILEHNVRLLVGPESAMRSIRTLVPRVRIFALTSAPAALALVLTDEAHEALHAANGTGEWLDFATEESGPRLTTTDMAFAARASMGSALSWIETCYEGGQGEQVAAAWIDGALAMKPNLLRTKENRPRSLRPINVALRLLGLTPSIAGHDEFEAFGLTHYCSNEAILARARAV